MLEQHLVILLMKLAASAALASILGRSSAFLRMLTREERTTPQRLQMAVGFAVIFGGGIVLRVLTHNNYQALDLGLEGALLAGVLGGYVTGLVGGILISLPACLMNGEWMAMLLYAGLGVTGGLLRDLAPSKDDIWRFSPYLDLTVYRLFRAKYDFRVTLFHGFVLLMVVFAEFTRWALSQLLRDDRFLYTLYSSWKQPDWLGMLLIYSSTIFAFAIPLKIWNSIRQEQLLGAQQRLLTEARLRALTSQINPHFLFNALNAVAGSIGSNPEAAEETLSHLADVFRYTLSRSDKEWVPLSEEMEFMQAYLAVERARFGPRLEIEVQFDETARDLIIPTMIVQPLVENAIKHGTAQVVGTGKVWINISAQESCLHVTVRDNGPGFPAGFTLDTEAQGHGLRNTRDRLHGHYGGASRLRCENGPMGAQVTLTIPTGTRR